MKMQSFPPDQQGPDASYTGAHDSSEQSSSSEESDDSFDSD